MIVKVQLSITTSERVRQVLVYNKDRSVFQQFDATEELAKLPLKSFWQAHIGHDKQLVLDHQVRKANW